MSRNGHPSEAPGHEKDYYRDCHRAGCRGRSRRHQGAPVQDLERLGKGFHAAAGDRLVRPCGRKKMESTLTAIGSVVAVRGVTIAPEIAGTVREIAFDSGAIAAKGDLLVRMDTSAEEAQLRSLEAQVQWAKVSLDR